MSQEELVPAISSQLAEMVMKHWSKKSKNPVEVNKILDDLIIPTNCSGIRVPILNEAVVKKNRKITPFHKRADKRLSDIQKELTFASLVFLEIADELILAQNENRPPNLKKVMSHTFDSVTLMGRAHKQISAERKKRLRPVLNKDRTLCDKETSDSKYFFGENLLESMKNAKESFRLSYSFVNKSTTKFQSVSYQEGCKRSFGYAISGAATSFSAPHSLNLQDRKRNHQHRGQSFISTKFVTSKKSHKHWGRGNMHPM